MKHSANFVKACLDVATGANYYPVAALLTADETNAINNKRDRIKRDLLEAFEIALLTNTSHNLRYDRHNDSVVFASTAPGQEDYLQAQYAQYWYRTMKKDEFMRHKREGEFVELPDFGGIAPYHKYSSVMISPILAVRSLRSNGIFQVAEPCTR